MGWRASTLGEVEKWKCGPPAAKRRSKKARHVEYRVAGSGTNRVPQGMAPGPARITTASFACHAPFPEKSATHSSRLQRHLDFDFVLKGGSRLDNTHLAHYERLAAISPCGAD